jgi:hypothetical protein
MKVQRASRPAILDTISELTLGLSHVMQIIGHLALQPMFFRYKFFNPLRRK